MLRFMLLAQMIYPTIEIYDSRIDSRYMNIIINHECMVSVLKSKMKDHDYIQKLVDDQCDASHYLESK